jgi:hypothetical protein
MYTITRGIQVLAYRPNQFASTCSGRLLMRLFSSTGLDATEDSLPDKSQRLEFIDRKECFTVNQKAYYEKKQAKQDRTRYMAEYHRKHRDATLDKQKRYYAEHAAAIREKSREYRERNKEAIQAYYKRYHLDNAAAIRE